MLSLEENPEKIEVVPSIPASPLLKMVLEMIREEKKRLESTLQGKLRHAIGTEMDQKGLSPGEWNFDLDAMEFQKVNTAP